MNPDLRLVLVDEGSVLDAEGRAAVAEWARETDVLVLMACVGEGGAGVVIEDGEVVR